MSAGNAGVGDEDPENHFEARQLAGGTDVLEGAAVSGVDAHAGEALGLDERNVDEDLGGGETAACVGVVGRVGYGPLVAGGSDA